LTAFVSIPKKQTFSSISSDSDEFKIFTKVEIEAEFPGGRNGWTRFLTNNLDSEVPGSNGAKPGQYTVIVRFTVAKDGTVSDVQAETNHGYGMEQESVRIIKKSGRWSPAVQNGRNVNSYKRQPITWVVSQ
jgi:protein TonB